MDDLKNVVIQTLEEEGTLGQLRAQLRARVFKAIEKNAEPAAKQAAGFQWQNPAAQKVHETEEARLVAHMIKEYLDFYRMEYTLSVYVPEAALSNQESLSREELQRRAGLQSQTQTPLLVQMLKQLKSGGASQPGKRAAAPTTHQQPEDPVKKGSTNLGGNKNILYQRHEEEDDNIREEIVEDYDDDHTNGGGLIGLQRGNTHEVDAGITASASLGIDQSIDTMRLDEYDYIEEVRFN